MEPEKHNPLFNRREVKLKIAHLEIPPSKNDAKKMISEKFSAPEEQIHINKIVASFGSKDFTIIAEIYNSKEEREKTNSINKKQKKEAAPAK